MTRHTHPDPLMISLTIPFPPSGNKHVRHFNGHHILSARTKAFREEVWLIVKAARIKPLTGRLSIEYTFHAPTRRRYDIFNMEKTATDALMLAGCFADDEAIDRGTVERGEVIKGGMCKVIILARGDQ